MVSLALTRISTPLILNVPFLTPIEPRVMESLTRRSPRPSLVRTVCVAASPWVVSPM